MARRRHPAHGREHAKIDEQPSAVDGRTVRRKLENACVLSWESLLSEPDDRECWNLGEINRSGEKVGFAGSAVCCTDALGAHEPTTWADRVCRGFGACAPTALRAMPAPARVTPAFCAFFVALLAEDFAGHPEWSWILQDLEVAVAWRPTEDSYREAVVNLHRVAKKSRGIGKSVSVDLGPGPLIKSQCAVQRSARLDLTSPWPPGGVEMSGCCAEADAPRLPHQDDGNLGRTGGRQSNSESFPACGALAIEFEQIPRM